MGSYISFALIILNSSQNECGISGSGDDIKLYAWKVQMILLENY